MKQIRTLFLSLALIALAALSAFATSITVGADTYSPWTFGGTTATIRIYATKTFVSGSGGTIIGGTTSGFYKTVNCTVASTTVSCPSVVLDSTTVDSSISTVRYVADLYDSAGKIRARFFDAFRVPISLGSPVTWAQLRTFNATAVAALPPQYYNKDEVNALIDGVAVGSVVGETAVSLFADLPTAVSTIGASPEVLAIDSDQACSTAIVIPSTLYLRFANGAKITKSSGCSITFSGVGVTGDPVHQIFSGFASTELVWTNEMPELRIEWFGGRGDNTTDNVAALNLALKICSRVNNKRGGVIKFLGGTYVFASTAGEVAEQYANVRLVGNSTKASAFGSVGNTVWKYTGTGSASAFRFRAAQAVTFDNLTISYSSTAFTGTLLDLSAAGGGYASRVTNCYLGGYWPPSGTVPMGAKYLLYLSGQIEAIVEKSNFVGGEAGIKMQPGLAEGGTDTNVITIKENTFNIIRGAAILNPYQGCIIEGNNFETLNFALSFGNLPTPNASMAPYAIDWDNGYPPDAVQYGIKITGNWFGDRVGSGGGYIRLGRVLGGIIDGNFFGGGYNSFLDYGAIAAGTNTGTTLTLAGQSLTTADIGRRVWVHSESWTGVITAILTGTTATVDTPFTSTFSSKTALITTSQVREYKSNASGSSGGSTVTVSGVTLPTDIWGRFVWIPSINYQGVVTSQTPTATTFTVSPVLPSTISNVNLQIGEYRYDSSNINIGNGASVAVVGNFLGNGMHGVNVQEDIQFDLTDISVSNGSPTVTLADARYTPCDLEGKLFEVAGGYGSAQWSVPGGTTITAVGGQVCGGGTVPGMTRGGTTLTLSNNVTVTSGENPRRAVIRNTSAGSTKVAVHGNRVEANGTAAQVINPFTNAIVQAIYSRKEGGRYSYVGNADLHDSGISHDFTTFNQGFFSEDFGGGDKVISIGNATTVPSSNPSSGVLLYSQSNALKLRNTVGTISALGIEPYATLTAFDSFAGHKDDYNPGSIAKTMRISSNSSTNELRGIKFASDPPAGTVLQFANAGSNAFIAAHNAGTSTFGYRLFTSTAGNLTINPKDTLVAIFLPDEFGWYVYALKAWTKSDVGLGNVDNTSDLNKPVSTATQTALDLKANLAGATFTGATSVATTFRLVTSTVITPGASPAINAALGNVFTLTPGEDENISISGMLAGQTITIIILTSGVTSRTLTFGTGFKPNGTLATGTVSGKYFVLQYFSDGTNVYELSRTTAL
jgi:hypothetical protein